MTKDEARKELLETLEEYCHDKGYGLQVFAGMADWVYTLYPKQKTITNADKIRGMADEQLAEFLVKVIDCWYCPTYQECTDVKSCDNALLAWLKQEYKSNSF
jgi:hypothetical protein